MYIYINIWAEIMIFYPKNKRNHCLDNVSLKLKHLQKQEENNKVKKKT